MESQQLLAVRTMFKYNLDITKKNLNRSKKVIAFSVNPFASGDFAEKRVLKLVEWFSGHCRAIKS